jgi:hypothetical protein
MLHWVSTGDPYTWTEEDYAHESEVTEPMRLIEEEEEDLGLPHLFNETGYRGSSDIDPNEPPAQEEEEERAKDDLPDLDEIENRFLDETPPGPPLHQSTPEKTGTRPKLRPPTEAQNQLPRTKELYPPFGPQDLYQARMQQLHKTYNEQLKNVHQEKDKRALRKQLYQNLEDAETSNKLLLKNPEMMSMTPEQLQQALATNSSFRGEKKKGLLKKLLTPKNDEEKPRTRFQLCKQTEKGLLKTVKK